MKKLHRLAKKRLHRGTDCSARIADVDELSAKDPFSALTESVLLVFSFVAAAGVTAGMQKNVTAATTTPSSPENTKGARHDSRSSWGKTAEPKMRPTLPA